jgi:hypothetical protein
MAIAAGFDQSCGLVSFDIVLALLDVFPQ